MGTRLIDCVYQCMPLANLGANRIDQGSSLGTLVPGGRTLEREGTEVFEECVVRAL
jgi:hypothetical protein